MFKKKTGEEGTLFEGDLKLRPGEKSGYTVAQKDVKVNKRDVVLVGGSGDTAGIMGESNLWPGGKIPWKFDHTLSE